MANVQTYDSKDGKAINKTPSLTHKNRQRSDRYGNIADKRSIIAEYTPGRSPIIRESTTGMTDEVELSGGKSISREVLTELQERVDLVIPFQDDAFNYKTQHFFGQLEWARLHNDWRRLLGMGLAHLVKNGQVPFKCINSEKSGTRIYRIKQ